MQGPTYSGGLGVRVRRPLPSGRGRILYPDSRENSEKPGFGWLWLSPDLRSPSGLCENHLWQKLSPPPLQETEMRPRRTR